jgi:hypothetical protein
VAGDAVVTAVGGGSVTGARVTDGGLTLGGAGVLEGGPALVVVGSLELHPFTTTTRATTTEAN